MVILGFLFYTILYINYVTVILELYYIILFFSDMMIYEIWFELWYMIVWLIW